MSKLRKFFRVLACGLTVAVIVGGAYLTCEYWDTLVGNNKGQISPLPDDEDKPDVTLTHLVKFIVDGEETVKTVADGECLTDIEDPVKEGYTFLGWYIGNTKIDFSTYIYIVTTDVTFTAVFEEIPQEPTIYTVKFVVDGIETIQTIEEGAYPTLPEEPTKEGYTFQGWYIGDTLIADVSTYVITEDTTFTAVFEEIPQEPTTYTVKFIVDGIETVQTIEEGAYPTLPEEPTKEGYTFQGWYIDDTLIADVSTYVITEDTTFTAVFEEIPQKPTTYTVKFVVDGIETVQTIEEGAYPTLPEEPTKEGYTFQGWYIGETLIADVSTYAITEDTTFTAVFSEVIKYYEVKFIVDGTTVKTDMYIEGQPISFAPEDPVKEGYTFKGWYVDDTLVNLSTYIVTAPVTFTAVFEEIPQEEPLNTTSASLFTFSGGMVTGYIGNESNVVIPKSYSIGETETETHEFANKTELKEFCTADNNYPYTVVDANGNTKTINNSSSFLFFTATFPVTYTTSFTPYIDGDDYQVTSVSVKAFNNCTVIESIVFPDYITSVGSYGSLLDSVFLGCTNIKSITIGKGLSAISSRFRFAGFPSLETIIVSEENPNYYSENNAVIEKSSKTLIIGCKNTIIPTDVASIGAYAFTKCYSLTSIELPSSITSIADYAFSGCSSLTSIVLPLSITSVSGSSFSGCSGLTSITVNDGNTVYTSRDNNGNECNAIIRISDNKLIHGCKNTIIPSTVTSIGGAAFNGCSELTSITIPDSVTSIEGNAFYNCTSLTTVNYTGSATQWNAIEISTDGNTPLTSATINYNYTEE